MKSPALQELIERGYMHQATDLDNLDTLMSTNTISFYTGFDCTAKSLHVGSLLQIMLMRLLQKHGHRPIIVMGGATTKIGDPSGKEDMRMMLADDAIETNKRSMGRIFNSVLSFTGESGAIMVDNSEWFSEMKYLDMLRICGKHFSVNRMLSLDSVKLRLDREQSLTFLEFNYMILQAYDFVELYKRYNCSLQFGGSDQWGNIVSGIDLGRRLENCRLFGLTTRLITKADGSKMGKTASGAVWLNKDMLSSYDFWQFWRNVDDADVIPFMKIYTEIPLDQIESYASIQGRAINDLKIKLANEITSICHGEDASILAHQASLKLFGKDGASQELGEGSMPRIELESSQLPIKLVDILVSSQLASSRSSGKKLISSGGAYINDIAVEDIARTISADDITSDDRGTKGIKISAGKKKHVMLHIVD